MFGKEMGSAAKRVSSLVRCFSIAVIVLSLLAGLAACSGSGGQDPAKPIADIPETDIPGTEAPGTPDRPAVVPVTGDEGSESEPDDTSQVQIPNDQGPASVPDGVASLDRIDLVVTSSQRCAVVNEPIEVSIARKLDRPEASIDEYPNVSGYVSFTQSLGQSLQLQSRTDESAIFAMNVSDIVGLTSSLEDGSITVFLASYFANAPDPFIIRKQVSGGCMYAFRSNDYCATGLAKSGTVSFARDGYTVSATGCDLNNPDNLPVIEQNSTARW